MPMEGDRFNLSAEEAVARCDPKAIGVVAILGSTFDGSYEPIKKICDALDDLQTRTGLDVPVHVDGASGGFVAPFIDTDLEWDFRLPRVTSINASGHKYGLVYPGVGWALWRDQEALPTTSCFGSITSATTCRPSRSTSRVRVPKSWRSTTTSCGSGSTGTPGSSVRARGRCRHLARIEELGPFRLITRGDELPVFAFTR